MRYAQRECFFISCFPIDESVDELCDKLSRLAKLTFEDGKSDMRNGVMVQAEKVCFEQKRV
jgi:hypothetical protein